MLQELITRIQTKHATVCLARIQIAELHNRNIGKIALPIQTNQ